MKLVFLYLSMILLNRATDSSFYNLQFLTLDGSLINTSVYKSKKVVVAVVSANTQNFTLVRYLDSIQKSSSSIQVIAVPTGDFGGSIKLADLRDLKKNLSITVTEPLRVKKVNTALQHPLFLWLTDVKQNTHFNADVSGEGHVYVINEKGELISCLGTGVPNALIQKVIR